MQGAHGKNRHSIEELADRLELELGALETFWSEIPHDQRPSVIGRIGLTAPGVARLLCPLYQRFSGPIVRPGC